MLNVIAPLRLSWKVLPYKGAAVRSRSWEKAVVVDRQVTLLIAGALPTPYVTTSQSYLPTPSLANFCRLTLLAYGGTYDLNHDGSYDEPAGTIRTSRSALDCYWS